MKNITILAVTLCAFMIIAGGCSNKAQEMETVARQRRVQVAELQQQIAELQAQLDQLSGQSVRDQDTINTLQKQRDELSQRIMALQNQVTQLTEANGALRIRGQLPQQLESDLKDFASKYANIASFDPTTGVVKFASDLTFPLGSATLSSEAEGSLAKLAEILNTPDAKGYEVRVVGYTDNVKISKPATREQHPTNWHLSVHRAIAVRDALERDGVPPVRTSVAGYGEYRPIVANGPRGATENRRVEIYLVPMPPVNEEFLKPSSTMDSTSTATPAPMPAPQNDAMFK